MASDASVEARAALIRELEARYRGLQPQITDPLPCIVCGHVPESVMPGHALRQPQGATVFYTVGQYGSTVFDPMSGSRLELEVSVCDGCLTLAAKQRRVILLTRSAEPFIYPDAEYWAPGGDDDE